MGQPATDHELLEASRRGERAAFGELVVRYQGLVCAVSLSGTRDRVLAEDVAQDAFVAAWHNLGQLRETSRFRGWLCGIARNLAFKAARRSRRERPDDTLDDREETAPSPFDAASLAETERQLWAALERIPDRYREVLVLYYQQQRSIREVAAILGISEDTAMQRLSRARTYLTAQLTHLIEPALERVAPRRDLASAVLAGIPPVGAPPPRVTGGSMWKLALGISAAAAVATVTLAVHHSSSPIAQAIAAPAPAAQAVKPQPIPFRPNAAARPAPVHAGSAQLIAPDPPDPVIDAATIARTGLYRGIARGPADAPVTIVVFADLQCEYCGKVLGTIDQLWEEYPGKLRLVMKQFPLPSHPFAELAAEATLAADAQDKFWPYHDLVLASQDDLSRDKLIAIAAQLELDVARFTQELDDHRYAGAVAADVKVATELEIHATPSFVINGHMVEGARSIESFRQLIDAELTIP